METEALLTTRNKERPSEKYQAKFIFFLLLFSLLGVFFLFIFFIDLNCTMISGKLVSLLSVISG